MRSRLLGILAGALSPLPLLSGCASDPGAPPPTEPTLMERAIEHFSGLQPVESPGNPTTSAGVALGRRLFYDPILSDNQTVSCASCHRQEFAFTDGEQFSSGSHGDLGTVNAPSIINPAWSTSFFWNGRAPSLEAQAAQPVPNPIEMNLPWPQAAQRLQVHAEYPALFERAFGTSVITQDLITNAIAQFERQMISIDSPYDIAFRGEAQLPPAAYAGVQLYFDETIGDCFHCHGVGPIFDKSAFPTDPNVFANNGLDSDPDPGLFEVTGDEGDRGKFKVPTLRNLGYTAPYMHDGRFATLEEVVRFYNTGMHTDSPNMNSKLRGNALGRQEGTLAVWTDTQIAQIVAFLESLNDPYFVTNPDLSDPGN